MAKRENRKAVREIEAEEPAVTVTSTYKPLPRFNGGCNNC